MLLLWAIRVQAQCNGNPELCNRRYDRIAYATTHNAFNSEEDGFTLPNQTYALTRQLEDGVRGLMLDVYDEGGVATVYHGFSFLGTALLADELSEIKDFLNTHPNEVVTIIFECYASASLMDDVFTEVGLIPMLYTHEPGSDWPTLQQMIDADTRLVVFTDHDDALPGQEWFHYVWDYAVETEFSVNDPQEFTCQFNRGDPQNDLFIFNHFVTDATYGTGRPDMATIVNATGFFLPRIVQCMAEDQKFPNFLTVDFYESGSVLAVVDSVNAMSDLLDIEEHPDNSDIQVRALPNGHYLLGLDRRWENCKLSITDMLGRSVLDQRIISRQNIELDLSAFPAGIYLVGIRWPDGPFQTVKLVR